MAKSYFTKLCNPAKLYLVVSVLGLVYGLFQRFSIVTLGTNFIFVILWTMVLNYIFSVGMKMVSWILVLLPYLMMFLSAGFVIDMMHEGGGKQGFQTCPPNQEWITHDQYGKVVPGRCIVKMTQKAIDAQTKTQKHCIYGDSFYDEKKKTCYPNPCPPGTMLKPGFKTYEELAGKKPLEICMCTLHGQKFVALDKDGGGKVVGCHTQTQIDAYKNNKTPLLGYDSRNLAPKNSPSPAPVPKLPTKKPA